MTSDNTWSTRMSFVFGLCALLGILLLIFSEVGMAQPAGNTFRPGGMAIGNPLNDPGAPSDDDFEEFDDGFDSPPVPAARPKPGSKTGGQPIRGSDDFNSGISVGGAPEDTSGPALKRGGKGFELALPLFGT